MDIVNLKVLDDSRTLDDALSEMRSSGRSGAVVKRGSTLSLITAEELFKSFSGQFGTIAGISGSPIHIPTASEILHHRASLANPVGFESLLDAAGKTYGLVTETGASILLATRHEHQALRLNSGPALCYCTNCGTPIPGGTTGTACRACGTLTVLCR